MTHPWTSEDIPDQAGRVVIITGSNQGLALEAARQLAARGATVVLAVRTPAKGQSAAASIRAEHPDARLEVVELDLGSLASIRAAADEVRGRFEHIDILINNAGVMFAPIETTADGFEVQLGTNHLGHFAWTGLLLDRMVDVPGSRVVTHSSVGHKLAPDAGFDDLDTEDPQRSPEWTPWRSLEVTPSGG